MASAPNEVKGDIRRLQGSIDATLDNEFHRTHHLPGISEASTQMIVNAVRRYLGITALSAPVPDRH